MTLEVRLKQAALKTAVTITLGGLEKAPERCARTLMELGRAAFPERVKAEAVSYTHLFLVATRTT